MSSEALEFQQEATQQLMEMKQSVYLETLAGSNGVESGVSYSYHEHK